MVQANNLHSAVQGLSNVIAVSHSNGGVVTRRYLTSHPGPLINRHISINSPHYGATLAASALNGQIGFFANNIYSAIFDPIAYYLFHDTAFWGVYVIVSQIASFLIGALGYVDVDAGLLGYGSAFLLQQIFGFVPNVLPEMVPGSAVLNAQLGPDALQLEATRTTRRFSISNELNPLLQPYSLFWQNPSQIQAFVTTMIGFALSRYGYYSDHPNFDFRMHAWLWQRLAVTLASMPLQWSQLNGSLLGGSTIVANDGVVPWSSSQYPGGSTFNMPAGQFTEVAHTMQTTSAAVRNAVSLLLQLQMGVPKRTPTPVPPAFTASIVGASTVPPNTPCNYSATVSGGTAPFQYQWYLDQMPVGVGGSSFFWSFPASAELSLVVTDASSATASSSLQVWVDFYAAGCF